MAAPAELREIAEKLVLAGVGAVALTAERADALAEELSARGGMGREEARALIEELAGRWRSEGVRLGERTGAGMAGLFRELGLVTRAELEELELRACPARAPAAAARAVNLLRRLGSVEAGWWVGRRDRAARGASRSRPRPATASSAFHSRAAASSLRTISPGSTIR